MKKIAALILAALLALSFTACGNQQNTQSTTNSVAAQSTQQDTSKSGTTASSTSSAGSKVTSVNPNASFTGKPVQKQQMNSATSDLKNTMSQIQSIIDSLDTASDVNTDNIQ